MGPGTPCWPRRTGIRAATTVAVYERCGAGPATWQRTVLTDATDGVAPTHSLRVGRDGTAMVVWRVTEGGTPKHYSRTRPPGGAWGAPQLIVADAGAYVACRSR